MRVRAEIGEEPGLEGGVVGHEHGGPERVRRRAQAFQGLRETGLSAHVFRGEVVDGRRGRGDLAAGIDEGVGEGPAGVVAAGVEVDADGDRGELDDGVRSGVGSGRLDVDGEGVEEWHGSGSFGRKRKGGRLRATRTSETAPRCATRSRGEWRDREPCRRGVRGMPA